MAKLFANDTIGTSYAEQMGKEHDGSKWGSTGARYSGRAVAQLVADRKYLQTALDYGCGKGSLAKSLQSLDWTEYDPGIPGKQNKPRGRYDLVTCTDVMEHVEKDYIEDVIKELGKYTKKVLFVDIACYLTGKTFAGGPYKGQDLHLTVWAPQVWLDLFQEHCGLTFLESRVIDKVSKGRRKRRVQITYERT